MTKAPNRPIYSRYTVCKSDLPNPEYPWYVTSVAYDDRFDYGSFRTWKEAQIAAYEWARIGVETDDEFDS